MEKGVEKAGQSIYSNIFVVFLNISVILPKLERMACYASQLPAPAEGFSLQPSVLLSPSLQSALFQNPRWVV